MNELGIRDNIIVFFKLEVATVQCFLAKHTKNCATHYVNFADRTDTISTTMAWLHFERACMHIVNCELLNAQNWRLANIPH